MLKLMPRGTPDELATLAEVIRQSPMIERVDVTEIKKRDASHKTGTAIFWVHFKETIKNDAPVGVWEPRRKRTSGTGRGKRDKTGYVYLLRAADGSHKIGKTKNPKSRKKTFDVKLPFRVEYAHLIQTDNMDELEKALHLRYTEKRLRGSEFFNLDPVDIEWIIALGSECTIAQYQTK